MDDRVINGDTLTAKIPNRLGLGIAVRIEIPENPKGLIVITHGWKSNKDSPSIAPYAVAALAHGLTVLRFDCTCSTGQSDGPVAQSTISSFVSDLDDVIDWAKTQPWFQSPYLMAGHSMGGIAILEHARRHPSDVRAIAPTATVISGHLSIEAYQRDDATRLARWQKTGFERQIFTGGSARFPWSHMEDRLKYNALDYAAGLTLPVFMCVGSEDSSCPPDHQRLLYEALGSRDKELHIIHGAPHAIREPKPVAELKQYFSDWLVKIE